MAQEPSNSYGDMEQVRRRFEEFRSANPARTPFPEAPWMAAVELATRHGMKPTARTLGLAVPSLRKRMGDRGGARNAKHVKPEQRCANPPAFVEFLAPDNWSGHELQRGSGVAAGRQTPAGTESRCHDRVGESNPCLCRWLSKAMLQLAPQMRILVALESLMERRKQRFRTRA